MNGYKTNDKEREEEFGTVEKMEKYVRRLRNEKNDLMAEQRFLIRTLWYIMQVSDLGGGDN